MKYDLIELIITIFDIFNNPIGITAVIVAVLIGILMCIIGNTKSQIFYICSLFSLALISIVVCVIGNSPDYLILPIFMLPFFTTTLIIILIYDLIRITKII